MEAEKRNTFRRNEQTERHAPDTARGETCFGVVLRNREEDGSGMAKMDRLKGKDRRRLVTFDGRGIEVEVFCRPGAQVESIVSRLSDATYRDIEDQCTMARARAMPADFRAAFDVLAGRRGDGWNVELSEGGPGKAKTVVLRNKKNPEGAATCAIHTSTHPHDDEVRRAFMLAYLVCKLVRPE
jgi:hypothetical protein